MARGGRGAIEGGGRGGIGRAGMQTGMHRASTGFADDIDRAGALQAQAAPVSCENTVLPFQR